MIKLGLARSRRHARDLLASGRLRVDGRYPRKGAQITEACAVELLSDAEAVVIRPNPALDIPVLYGDPILLIVNKPALLPCHPLRPDEIDTVMNGVAAKYPETALCGDKPLEGGLIHRLDNGTSGALMIARTATAVNQLRADLRQGKIVREYRAVVSGDIAEPVEINSAIAHHPHNRRKMVTNQAGRSRARPAFTTVAPLGRYGDFTLVAVRPRTGCRHQIRVHLASIGHPLAGDAMYGGIASAQLLPGRVWLHLAAVDVDTPSCGRAHVEAPLPADLAEHLMSIEEH